MSEARREKVFMVDGRIEIVVDSSLQICLRVPTGGVPYAITNVSVFKDTLDQARQYVRITR